MVFRNSIEPAFCVTFEADITNFKEKTKEQGLSFTMAMVYAVCKCANEIKAFRYRFLDGKIVLFDRINTAFTYLNPETELFKVVNVPMKDDISEYVALAVKTANEQKEYFTGPLGNDVFQCSPMPPQPTIFTRLVNSAITSIYPPAKNGRCKPSAHICRFISVFISSCRSRSPARCRLRCSCISV